jgi:nicotinate phosphoribosyltransferase
MLLRRDEQIITNLLDQDLYKMTMMQVAMFKFPEAIVRHEFRLRNKDVNLSSFASEIREQVKSLEMVRFEPSDLAWLKSLRFIRPEFIPFLKLFRFDTSQIDIKVEDGELKIATFGPWWQTILYEIFVLAIVNEVYFQNKLKGLTSYEISNIEQEGRKRLKEKLDIIKDVDGFQFIEFGTRRRFSKEWQKSAMKQMMDYLPKGRMVGTSNMLLAKEFDLIPIGTMAHEYLQSFQGLGICPLVKTQETALEVWSDFYKGDLGIALTDVINMDSFLKSFNLKEAKLFDGLRHDSGNPIVWGEKAIAHYEALRIDPKTKSLVFSDGLNFQKALDIFNHFNGKIKTSYGIGTNITNDLGFTPLNIVMKMTECNGNPVAKISDEPGKSLCQDEQFLAYLMKVHNEKPTIFEKDKYSSSIYY